MNDSESDIREFGRIINTFGNETQTTEKLKALSDVLDRAIKPKVTYDE